MYQDLRQKLDGAPRLQVLRLSKQADGAAPAPPTPAEPSRDFSQPSSSAPGPAGPGAGTNATPIAQRVADYVGPDHTTLGGVLGKYAKLVSSASEGAVT